MCCLLVFEFSVVIGGFCHRTGSDLLFFSSYNKRPYIHSNTKKQPDNTKKPPKPSIIQRFRSDLGGGGVSRSNDSHLSGVGKPVNEIPTFPHTTKTV